MAQTWHRVKCQLCGALAEEPVFPDLPNPFCDAEGCNGRTDEIEIFLRLGKGELGIEV